MTGAANLTSSLSREQMATAAARQATPTTQRPRLPTPRARRLHRKPLARKAVEVLFARGGAWGVAYVANHNCQICGTRRDRLASSSIELALLVAGVVARVHWEPMVVFPGLHPVRRPVVAEFLDLAALALDVRWRERILDEVQGLTDGL